MDVNRITDKVIRSRHATRFFLNKSVERKAVTEILNVARFAPSNSNTQPWRLYVVAGTERKALSEEILAAHLSSPEEHVAEYDHFPVPLFDRYLGYQHDFAARYYSTLNIERSDMSARHAQTGRNFAFFNAPIGFIFTIDRNLERGSWLDYGCFLQTIMLAAKSRGLDTCPQISFAKYHTIIRKHLPIPQSEIVICGMSLGYADLSEKVNTLRLPREPVEAFASFFGFDDRSHEGNETGKEVYEQA